MYALGSNKKIEKTLLYIYTTHSDTRKVCVVAISEYNIEDRIRKNNDHGCC